MAIRTHLVAKVPLKPGEKLVTAFPTEVGMTAVSDQGRVYSVVDTNELEAKLKGMYEEELKKAFMSELRG